MSTLSRLCVAAGGDVASVEVLPDETSLTQFLKWKHTSSEREDREDAFFVVDLGRVLHMHGKWRAALPNIQPFYAVKCNDDIMLLKSLAALGTGFDCASKNEMKTILELGVAPNQIIYANPCKQISHLKFAAKKGVDLMTFDDELELHKIKQYFPSARLVLRIRADCPDLTLQLGIKYGCSVSVGKTLLLMASSMGLSVVGVSFHVGSDCETPSSYLSAMEMAAEVFHYAAEVGQHLTLLDIGGGFPGAKTKDDLFSRMASCIDQGLALFTKFPGVKVIAEPGRFFACSTHAVAVNVIGKKVLHPNPKESQCPRSFMYYVNDGVYGSFNGVLYEHASPVPALLNEHRDGQQFKASIWGPTCDGVDKICHAMMPELEVGDWLYFDNMGAYSVCAYSSFNGFSRPASHYYIRESQSEQLGSMLGLCDMKSVAADEDFDQAEVSDDSIQDFCALPIEQPHALAVY